MPELEDAETELAAQERWGLSRVGVAATRLAAAVRVLRGRVATHEQRLAQIETRLDRIDPPG
jgi:hypothetical protein